MITRIRQYTKREPSRDAHRVFIICEGELSEPKYFSFFEGLSQNLCVITIPPESGTDPIKLAQHAEEKFDAEMGKYSLDYLQGDSVWFVIDTDTWEKEGKVAALRKYCKERNQELYAKHTETKQYDAWRIAQSNPCFEIWLYYHFYSDAPSTDEVIDYETFKQFVCDRIHGGFNYQSDPSRLKTAIANARKNFHLDDQGKISLYSTELYSLGEEIYSFVSVILTRLYNKMA